MKAIKMVFKGSLYLLATFGVYVCIVLIYGTLTDFQPADKISLQASAGRLERLDKDSLSFVNWNIGYSNLGKRANFFYDNGGFFFSGGKMVKSPSEDVRYYFEGIKQFIKDNPADFVLLQEVDSMAKRSYYQNQYDSLASLLPEYSRAFAVNFKSDFVPLPLVEFWNTIGDVYAGLATYSRYQLLENIRYQYPAHFSWPTRIFNLDRCAMVSKIATGIADKFLYVINSHNSAYDSDGSLRKQEMQFLKNLVVGLYEQGHYVVVGSDWNQCPPNFAFNKFFPALRDSSQYMGNVSADLYPQGWTWAADTSVPSHRDLIDTLQLGKTFATVIDYYLLSPNVELLGVKTSDLKFEFSDHQPVKLSVRLKK